MIVYAILLIQANAWGNQGHALVGQVAQEFLTARTKGILRHILPQYNGTLRYAANWADQIKSDKAKWSWAEVLHYVDTKDKPSQNCSYVDERDCPDNKCIVGAIANYTGQAKCVDGRLNGSKQEIAVKFLTHFIGDITQPLHVCGRLNVSKL